VFFEFLTEANYKLANPFDVDLLFVFMVMLSRGIQKLKGRPEATRE
jgi:hypothetical protein